MTPALHPSPREPSSRERTKGSGAEEQRGDSAKEPCRPTRTNALTQPQIDLETRGRDQNPLFGNGKLRGPARAHDPDRGDQDGRSIARPDSTDWQTRWHTRTNRPGGTSPRRWAAWRPARAGAAQVRWLCVGCVGGRDGSRPSRPPHGHAGRFSGGQSSRRGRQGLQRDHEGQREVLAT